MERFRIKLTPPRKAALGLLIGVCLCFVGCGGVYYKELQRQRLHYAAEQIQQSIDEIQVLNDFAEKNQLMMMPYYAETFGWTDQDKIDSFEGIKKRSSDVQHYLYGLEKAKEQISAASNELAQMSNFTFRWRE